MKVKVSKKDLLRVITQADERTQWNTSSWKARKRLLDAVSEGSDDYDCGVPGCREAHPDSERVLRDYCAIPDCGCPGDRSHS